MDAYHLSYHLNSWPIKSDGLTDGVKTSNANHRLAWHCPLTPRVRKFGNPLMREILVLVMTSFSDRPFKRTSIRPPLHASQCEMRHST